ncbi:MAG: type II and III secretion system protein family protein [Alphaproteobacteria bacterium]|jgi:pilus assembly protein CpaC|nr:type II and III secretion system protein family protein [Alphaproteobacteria bacterium]
MRSLFRALLVTGAVLMAAPAAPTAEANEVIGRAATPLSLEISQGRLVRLEAPADSVFIADPAIADVEPMSPQLIYVFGRASGVTNLFAVGDDDEIVASMRLTVGPDMGTAGSGARATPTGAGVVLSGTTATAEDATDAVATAAASVPDPALVDNRMLVDGPQQVNLRVRIAEVQRTLVSQLGINWQALNATAGNFTFGLLTRNAPASLGGNLVAAGAGSVFTSNWTDGAASIDTVLDALEEEGFVSILAEPNLTAMSGESASFLAGGEFPVPVAQDDDTLTIEFKEFGVSLSFVPTVLDPHRISLRVRPEVSQLSSNGAIEINGLTIPALTTRRAETTVEMASGQSFAIGGLFQSNIAQGDDGVPYMNDLPVLGPLFSSQRFQRQESELVIIVTPYLVEPSSEQLALPNERISERRAPSSAITAFAEGPDRAAGATGGFILK